MGLAKLLAKAPKGSFWLLLGTITVSVIIICSFLLTHERPWCNEKLGTGECEIYEIDHTCFCVDMINNDNKTTEYELSSGLYEQAVNQCNILGGMLATPDDNKLMLRLSKKIYAMGVDNAFVGLQKIDSTWFWIKPDGAQTANIEWRKDFPPSHQDKYGMISVETYRKDDEEEYFGYKNYNYQHYIENDPNYQWFGFTTSDNSLHGDFDKAFFICHYLKAPAQMPVDGEAHLLTTASEETANNDPCFCSSHKKIDLPKLEDSATFTSPKYPSNYCSDLNCRWMVSTTSGLTVKLEWLVFSIEKNMDFVYIYDGDSDDSAKIDTCTSSSCRSHKSSSNLMQIHFHTDHVTTDLGFKARVTAIDPDVCYCSSMSEIQLTNLGESYRFVSPGYPQPYCTNRDCKWRVVAPQGYGLHVMWNEFQTLPTDFVQIYDQAEVNDATLTKCSGSECSDMISPNEGIVVNFISGSSSNSGHIGFSGVATVVQNFCIKFSDELVGSITYGTERDDDTIPVGATATLTCPVNHVTSASNELSGNVTCKSPNWESDLERCIRVCELRVTSIADFTAPIHICTYENEFSSVGTPKGQIILDSIVPSGILLISGQKVLYYESGQNLQIELYSPVRQTTAFVEFKLPSRISSIRSAVLPNGQILAISSDKRTKLIDLSRSEINDGPSMQYKHPFGGVSVLGAQVWVCGGEDYWDICESYDESSWTERPNMLEGRSEFALVTLDSDLYALGGYSWIGMGSNLRSVEKYSSHTDAWEKVAKMIGRRHRLAAAELDHKLIACGGQEDVAGGQLSSCEIYHPTQDKWESIRDMIQPKMHFQLIDFYGKIYAIGVTETEQYDYENDMWITGGVKLLKPRYMASAVVVPAYGE